MPRLGHLAHALAGGVEADERLAQQVDAGAPQRGPLHAEHPLHARLARRQLLLRQHGELRGRRLTRPAHLPVRASEEDGGLAELLEVVRGVRAAPDRRVHHRVASKQLPQRLRVLLPGLGEGRSKGRRLRGSRGARPGTHGARWRTRPHGGLPRRHRSGLPQQRHCHVDDDGALSSARATCNQADTSQIGVV
eukprot:scaffold23436_cov68-Phaeocystis_antarctica.AAC.6